MNKKLAFAFLLMGFTSLIVQTLLIREFLITFYGNELSIGLILANWIVLEALGSWLASRPSIRSKRTHLVYAALQLAISVYLPVSIYLARTAKNLLGLTLGEGVGIFPIFFSSLLIIAPLGIFDGAQFPFGCRMLSDSSKRPLESSGRVYILEALGFILAGPLFTYILITKLNSFYIAFFLGWLNLLSAALLLMDNLKDALTRMVYTITNTVLVLTVIAFFGPASKMHDLSITNQWRGQKVLTYQNSVYGNLAVTEAGGQYTFYGDGIPMITTPFPDVAFIEELVHFTILNQPDAKTVLLLGGAAGGVINEVLKYNCVEKVVYLELDPLLIKLVNGFPTPLTERELSDPRLEVRYIDGRRFLWRASSKYDVVIVNMPMPLTLQLNRFYTREFFENVKAVLNENGIFSFALPGSLSYISPALQNLNGSILNTLEDIFYVNIVPGDRNLYIASNNPLKLESTTLVKRLEETLIETRLLNKLHIAYRLNPRWLAWFKDSMSDYKRIRKNYDLLPSGAFYGISYWNTLFSKSVPILFRILDRLNSLALFSILLIMAAIALVLKGYIAKSKRSAMGLAIATTGFVAMSFDLIIIYAYQSFYGFVFHHLALLVASFMAGLTVGGWLMTRALARIKDDIALFSKIEFTMAGFFLMAGPLLLFIKGLGSPEFSFLFFLLSMLAGCLVGLEFPLANKIYGRNRDYAETGGLLYALDLGGAWVAALAVSIALIPVIGILHTCLLAALLKIISLVYVTAAGS